MLILEIAAGVALAPVLVGLVMIILAGLVGLYRWYVDNIGGFLVLALITAAWYGVIVAVANLGTIEWVRLIN